MSRIAHLLTQPVMLREPQADGTDAFGQSVVNWVEHPVVAYVRPVSTVDTNGGAVGTLARSTHTLYLDPSTPMGSGWQVDVDGDLYEVAGEPMRHWNPRTESYEYLSVALARVVL